MEVDELHQKLAYSENKKVKQFHIETGNLEYDIVSSQSTKRVFTLKRERYTTGQLLNSFY